MIVVQKFGRSIIHFRQLKNIANAGIRVGNFYQLKHGGVVASLDLQVMELKAG